MAAVPPSANYPPKNRSDVKPTPSASSSAPDNNNVTAHDQSQAGQSAPSSDLVARLPPDEESALVNESNALKQTGSTSFANSDFSSAISYYDRAFAALPSYLDYEVAVLKSNISACHLKLKDWKAAIEAASAALDSLEHVLPSPKPKKVTKTGEGEQTDAEGNDVGSEAIVELDGDSEDALASQLRALELDDQRRADVLRIRSKSLLRRAKARSSLTSWSDLAGAEEDYKMLLSPTLLPSLPLSEKRTVQASLRELPERIKEAREQEVGEMMGKLKELGNTVLKPFGLSTDMFKFQQQEGGGYSMSVETGGGSRSGGDGTGEKGQE